MLRATYTYLDFIRARLYCKKIEAGKTVYQCFPNVFVGRHRKAVDQISRHTSHANLFLLIASGIIWRSSLLRATLSGNRVPNDADLQKNGCYLSRIFHSIATSTFLKINVYITAVITVFIGFQLKGFISFGERFFEDQIRKPDIRTAPQNPDAGHKILRPGPPV